MVGRIDCPGTLGIRRFGDTGLFSWHWPVRDDLVEVDKDHWRSMCRRCDATIEYRGNRPLDAMQSGWYTSGMIIMEEEERCPC